jgi:hypothetical protein
VFARVASGALHASALSLLKKHLTPENAAELFELCAHQSARKVEELLAARFPRPDVRDLVRRLTRFAIPEGVPAQAGPTLDAGCASEKMPTEAPPRESTAPLQEAFVESRLCEAKAASRAAEAPKPGRLEPLSADRYGVHFTADGEFRELLERVRGLAGHRLPNGDLMTLLKCGLEAYERELTKERFALGSKPRRSRGVAPAPSAPSAPDGRRCSARRCLELDHIDPWAVRGENTIENLRLRCRAHNQRYARRYYGKSRVEAAVRQARRRRAVAGRSGKADQA